MSVTVTEHDRLEIEVSTMREEMTRLENRKVELEREIAGAWGKDTPKHTAEYALVTAQLAAAPHRLRKLESELKEAQVSELLAKYEQRAGEVHAAYTVMTECDAEIKTHQQAIEGLLKRRFEAETTKTTNSGRMGKLQADLAALGVKMDVLTQIRRKFPPIPLFWG